MKDIIKGAVSHNWAFWICLSTSLILIIASFIIPPTGIIDSSVLAAVGELFGFGALGSISAAVAKGMDARVTKGDTSIEIGHKE